MCTRSGTLPGLGPVGGQTSLTPGLLPANMDRQQVSMWQFDLAWIQELSVPIQETPRLIFHALALG